MIIITRPELDRVLEGEKILLFGRRKTGKTFYSRYKKNNWEYYIFTRGGNVLEWSTKETLDLRTFMRTVNHENGVIIDEFHRAPEEFFSFVQAGGLPENTVLITSTMHYYRHVKDVNSPILGMFSEFQVDLVHPADLLAHPWENLDKKTLELLFFYQEPTQIGKTLKEIVLNAKYFVPALVGEILEEEDRTHSERIEGILEAVAVGKNTLTEISGYLHSKKIIDSQSTSLITPYMKTLVDVGLLKRVRLHGTKKRSIYTIPSPLIDLTYYLNGKYGFYDVDLPWDFVQKVLEKKAGLYAERFFERTLSRIFGLQAVKIMKPEIDIALASFEKIRIVAEVKWKNRIKRSEVREAEAKLAQTGAEKRILIVPDASAVPETDLEVWDVERIVKEIRKRSRSAERLKHPERQY
ncbi:MAG: ATP-binding protein [Candidatus Diapherotrites archaeon]|nr:ATP-binding protein [Candidatus Diapherotrites archaeon]